jgi:hypothetical protein
MREHATLRLTDGREVPVEVDTDDLDQVDIVVHKLEGTKDVKKGFLEVIDQHLATAAAHPAGTTDRFLAEDRSRPY